VKNNGWKRDKHINYLIDDPIYQVHEYGLNAKANYIYLTGEEEDSDVGGKDKKRRALFTTKGEEFDVTDKVARKFEKNMDFIRHKSTEPILIKMHMNGGEWTAGMAIYDAIRACPNPVTIVASGEIESMSSIIFLAANKSILMPNSLYMIHRGNCSYDGDELVVESQFKFDARTIGPKAMEIYVSALKRQGKFQKWSEAKIEKKIIAEYNHKNSVYFTPEEAVAWGFADGVFGQDEGGYDWGKLTDYTDEQLRR